jgi:hypothetical protein
MLERERGARTYTHGGVFLCGRGGDCLCPYGLCYAPCCLGDRAVHHTCAPRPINIHIVHHPVHPRGGASLAPRWMTSPFPPFADLLDDANNALCPRYRFVDLQNRAARVHFLFFFSVSKSMVIMQNLYPLSINSK